MYCDPLQHPLRFMQHLRICEPKYRQATIPEIHVASFVSLPLIWCIVIPPVAFYHQQSFMTVEVADVRTELVLPPKLCSIQLPVSKKLP